MAPLRFSLWALYCFVSKFPAFHGSQRDVPQISSDIAFNAKVRIFEPEISSELFAFRSRSGNLFDGGLRDFHAQQAAISVGF